jgi:hypothetical protein
MDVEAALAHLRREAQPQSLGKCARYVRLALQEGGVVIDPHPELAKDYGPYLERYGFSPVQSGNSVSQPGDVCVIQGFEGHPAGHIVMFDGTKWISDFVQRDIWAGPEFRERRPPMQVYRTAAAAGARVDTAETQALPQLERYLRLTRPMLRGDDVVMLQSRLKTAGWAGRIGDEIRTVDGLFGPDTQCAVTVFQRSYGLEADGIVGPDTWSRLWLRPNAKPADVSAARQRAVTAASPEHHTAASSLAALAEFHRRFDGGERWRLTVAGLETDAGPVASTGEHRAKARTVLGDWFRDPIRRHAARNSVPVELIVATICTESAGNRQSAAACARAERRERGFRDYVSTPHRVSLGCMQTLISTATSVLGRPVSHIELLDPDVSIEAGTRYIAQEAAKTRLDPPVVACAYNAGGVYPEPSADNRWRMRQYPIGTSAHADRFVAYFNGCLEETKANPALAGEAPAFAKMI